MAEVEDAYEAYVRERREREAAELALDDDPLVSLEIRLSTALILDDFVATTKENDRSREIRRALAIGIAKARDGLDETLRKIATGRGAADGTR